jgi:hypothetical protein
MTFNASLASKLPPKGCGSPDCPALMQDDTEPKHILCRFTTSGHQNCVGHSGTINTHLQLFDKMKRMYFPIRFVGGNAYSRRPSLKEKASQCNLCGITKGDTQSSCTFVVGWAATANGEAKTSTSKGPFQAQMSAKAVKRIVQLYGSFRALTPPCAPAPAAMMPSLARNCAEMSPLTYDCAGVSCLPNPLTPDCAGVSCLPTPLTYDLAFLNVTEPNSFKSFIRCNDRDDGRESAAQRRLSDPW